MLRMDKIKDFINSSIRVLKVAKKPTKEEFMTIAKITGLGIILIGIVGYIIETIRWLFLR
ncbi:MAG: protein translocase SEC61 complex subunit gamma [archaeon]